MALPDQCWFLDAIASFLYIMAKYSVCEGTCMIKPGQATLSRFTGLPMALAINTVVAGIAAQRSATIIATVVITGW
jgi:hypothetical protein